MSVKLPATRANMRRLMTIYLGLTGAGGIGSAVVGALLLGPMDFDGPIIAVSVVAVGVFLGGGLASVYRMRVDRLVTRLLLESPKRVVRVYPKLTESSVRGSVVASYSWLVVEDDAGQSYDLYGGDDVRPMLRELRSRLPEAEFDAALRVERLNLR